MFPKRKKVETSNSAIVEKRHRSVVWGASKNDLVTVEITATETNSIRELSNVAYKPYGQEETVSLPIKPCYTEACLEYSVNRSVVMAKLQPLIDQLTPLGTLIEDPESASWTTSIDPKTICPERGVCHSFVRAFLMDMTDTDGKSAVRSLMTEVISYLDLNDLDVVAGSGSHVSAFSTSFRLTISPEGLSEEANNSKSFPDQKKHMCNSSVSEEKPPKKLSIPDILVFSQSPNLDEPIQTKLVVSVKRGFDSDTSDLIKELLSRLPYQTGSIFGLQINSRQATLCAVKADSIDGSEKMNIFTYPKYVFRRFNKPFDFEAFSDMVEDIGCLLQSN